MSGRKIGVRISHHKAGGGSGVGHPLVIRPIGDGHDLSAQEYVARPDDGVLNVLEHSGHGQGAHRRISTIEPDLTSHRILVPELSLGERLTDQDSAYRGLPLTEVALHERETEHIEKRRVSVRSPGVHDVAVDLVLLHSVAGI